MGEGVLAHWCVADAAQVDSARAAPTGGAHIAKQDSEVLSKVCDSVPCPLTQRMAASRHSHVPPSSPRRGLVCVVAGDSYWRSNRRA